MEEGRGQGSRAQETAANKAVSSGLRRELLPATENPRGPHPSILGFLDPHSRLSHHTQGPVLFLILDSLRSTHCLLWQFLTSPGLYPPFRTPLPTMMSKISLRLTRRDGGLQWRARGDMAVRGVCNRGSQEHPGRVEVDQPRTLLPLNICGSQPSQHPFPKHPWAFRSFSLVL